MKQWVDELNKDGIFLLDTYILNYYGVIVFLQVCKTDTDRVAVYELATKKKKINGEYRLIITKKIRETKDPLIVDSNDNTWQKSNYWVKPVWIDGELRLPIEVRYNSRLYLEAKRTGTDYPVFGTAYAMRIKNIKSYYWEIKEKSYLA